MRTRPALAAAAAALVAALALAGCTAATSADSAGGSAGAAVPFARAASGTSASGAETATVPDRQVVTTGTVALVADHPVAVADRIQDLVAAAGGTVADSTLNPTGRATANLTLRIPAAVFPTTLAAIERTADLRNVDVTATDVTATVTDYGVRITNLRTSITRLQQLLARATSSSALVEIEGSLTDRQGQLEQLLAQQRALDDQVALSTLTVSIVTPAAAPTRGPNDFLAGLVTGWRSLVATLAAVAIGAGVALPWVVLLCALGAAGVAVTRLMRRRTRTA